MSLAVVYSRANVGIAAKLVEVEVHLSNNLPGFSIVGLPETVVKESKDRVRSAIVNSQFNMPQQRITVNLAPADLPKEGGRYDLAIALGILLASKQLPEHCLTNYEVGGELALSGEVRPFFGSLPMVVAALRENRAVILPQDNAIDCARVTKAKIFSVTTLLDVCAHLWGQKVLQPVVSVPTLAAVNAGYDMSQVSGQHQAKRALEIAAAGGHSALMIGAPGSGKTMLASRLPSVLPEMSEQACIEVALVHSLCGNKEAHAQGWSLRPFRAPHHSVSSVALIGGGRVPRPGEVSLAHGGVLFLDELPEFQRAALEALREPLESGEVLVSRAAYAVKYPAQFQLIAAMNPCPCGYWGDSSRQCRCTAEQVQRYQHKLSGPLLDRIDLQFWVRPVDLSALLQTNYNTIEKSADVKARVSQAQALQYSRANKLNCYLTPTEIHKHCTLNGKEATFLQKIIAHYALSARAYHRILKVARTIADLEQSATIESHHVQEVMILRSSVTG